ncbi:hypothetical protein GCM10027082_44630 [Comamonas humi]
MNTTTPSAAPVLDRTFTHRLHALAKVTDRVSQWAYEHEVGIPISEGRCLAAIGAFYPLSVNDLAMYTNLNKAQASRSTQSLVERALVLKQTSDVDGRSVVLTLTPTGRDLWLRLMAVIERRNREMVSALNAEEQALFSQMLDRLLEHARNCASATPA